MTIMDNRDVPPSVLLSLLYERTSAKGKRYFAGRLGAAKIAVVPAREPAEDGTPIWRILVSEAPPKNDTRASSTKATTSSFTSRQHAEAAARNFERMPNDEVPF